MESAVAFGAKGERLAAMKLKREGFIVSPRLHSNHDLLVGHARVDVKIGLMNTKGYWKVRFYPKAKNAENRQVDAYVVCLAGIPWFKKKMLFLVFRAPVKTKSAAISLVGLLTKHHQNVEGWAILREISEERRKAGAMNWQQYLASRPVVTRLAKPEVKPIVQYDQGSEMESGKARVCPKGHRVSGENAYRRKSGAVQCRTCVVQGWRDKRARERDERKRSE